MKPKVGDFIEFELAADEKNKPGFFKRQVGEVLDDWQEFYRVSNPSGEKVLIPKTMKFRKIKNVFFAYKKE